MALLAEGGAQDAMVSINMALLAEGAAHSTWHSINMDLLAEVHLAAAERRNACRTLN